MMDQEKKLAALNTWAGTTTNFKVIWKQAMYRELSGRPTKEAHFQSAVMAKEQAEKTVQEYSKANPGDVWSESIL